MYEIILQLRSMRYSNMRRIVDKQVLCQWSSAENTKSTHVASFTLNGEANVFFETFVSIKISVITFLNIII